MKKFIILLCTHILCLLPLSAQASGEWSGTGFALNGGYVVTNYHVIDGAASLKVRGIQGDFSKSYKAIVVATDPTHDLAIIKIADSRFMGFGEIPYSLKSDLVDVGEDIFVLGYPMIDMLGEEVKLTTGIVSSRTGFAGEVSLYQISAPIQGGNSGGPLLDSNGDVVGVVNAKIRDDVADNVCYAIKSPYLRLFIQSNIGTNVIPTNRKLAGKSLVEKVRAIKPFVFIIQATSSSASGNRTRSSSSSGHTSGAYRVGDVVSMNGVPSMVIYTNSSGQHGLLMSLKQTRSNWSEANSWCNSLGKGWHLPNKEELGALYANKSAINTALAKKGYSQLDTTYWASDPYSSDYGWYVNISTGYSTLNYKSSYSSVRAMYIF
uniref:trypsin-like peptidase domain-containing protein n=1 Tax=Alistipes sp. TaxID=1872444 RepID=UPI0040573358